MLTDQVSPKLMNAQMKRSLPTLVEAFVEVSKQDFHLGL